VKKIVMWVGLPVLGWAMLESGPAGGQADKKGVSKTEVAPPFGQVVQTAELKAGETTHVIVSETLEGEEAANPNLRQGVYVFDVHGNCLAWDDFAGPKGRNVGVIFVPTADGVYTVVARSFCDRRYRCQITIR
jgi:hypothetical protein